MWRSTQARRDFLKLGGAGIAGAVTESLSSPAVASSGIASPLLYDVRTFGAAGDGKTVDTPSVNSAIAAASAKGGGTVVFGPAAISATRIHLKSHIALFLDPGATIVAADTPAGAPAAAMIRPSLMHGTSFRTSATATGITA